MDPHENRDLSPGIGWGNALTIFAVYAVLGGFLAWLTAPALSRLVDSLTAPPPACMALGLTAAECGALMEDAR